MRPNAAPEAPTHLGSHQLPLPPEWLPDVDDIEPPTRAARSGEVRQVTERSVNAHQPAYGYQAPEQLSVSMVTPRRRPAPREDRESVAALPPVPSRDDRGRAARDDRHRSDDRAREDRHRSDDRARDDRHRSDDRPRDDRHRSDDRARDDRHRSDDRARDDRHRSSDRHRGGSDRHHSDDRSRSADRHSHSHSRSAAGTPRPEPSRPAPAPRAAAAPAPAPRAAPTPAPRAASAPAPAPAPAPRAAPAAPAPRAASSTPVEKGRTASAEKSRSASPTPAAPTPSPEVPNLPPGLGAIDPMQVPVPPELAATIFGWVRRLALQADLAGADRVLRDALADLTSSLSVSIVYPGQEGLWTLGADEEIPRDAQPIIAVARARRALITSHSALVPVVTSSEVVAVVSLSRNPRNPGYHPAEQIAAIALARESAAILHHLAVAHIQNQAEIEADKGGLYRGEALEAHRKRGQEGQVVHLSPTWVRRTYPILVVAILTAVIASIFITVPTYSTGQGVVLFEGTPVNAPAGGTVEAILVKKGQPVKQGQVLVKLHSAVEAAELAQATTDYENATTQYLYDQTDEQTKKTLAAAAARVERARAQADTRVVRARKDGTVGDIRVIVGAGLNPNDNILSIVAPGTEPEITAFLPGKDRPRLRVGMELQVELIGFTKVREIATITSVGTEIIGGDEIMRRILGPGLADSFKQLQGGSFVLVKAKLPARTFKTEHRTYRYYHGLQAKTEVKIQSKPFLVTLLPALEKYIPD